MKESLTQQNLHCLISDFYAKVREDGMLGPIFNPMIHNWEEHEKHITSFWEKNLFFTGNFRGNPPVKHQEVDSFHNNIITMDHFGRWIFLWIETIDAQYHGLVADKAKRMARKMATFLFLKIVEGRGN